MTMLNEKQLKEVFYEDLFSERQINYSRETNGMYIDFQLQCNNRQFNGFLMNLYKRYEVKHSYNDYMIECMYHTYISIMRFHIRDSGSWQAMIEGTDKANLGRLFSSIKLEVENEIYRFINDVKRTTIKGQNTTIDMKFQSLNMLASPDTDSHTTLLDLVDKDFFTPHEGYSVEHFLDWFHANKEEILTKKQLERLELLGKASHQKDGYTENDLQKVLGVSRQANEKMMNTIRVNVLKAFKKSNPNGLKSNAELSKEREISLWNQIVHLVYSDNINSMNEAVAMWVRLNIDNSFVNDLLYDNMTGDSASNLVKLVRGYEYPTTIVYEIVGHIEDRLEYLQQLNTNKVSFYKKKSEMAQWTPEAHAHYKKVTRKSWTKASDIRVYNHVGELLRVDKHVEVKSKRKERFVKLNPMGLLDDVEY